MDRRQRIEHRLQQAFAPSQLEVIDDSASHEGHAGARPGGQTHYHVRITSTYFQGKNRVAQQRAIYAELQEEFDTGLHALSLEVSAG